MKILKPGIREIDFDAIKSFQDRWKEAAPQIALISKMNKEQQHYLYTQARAIYYRAYCDSWQDASMIYLKDTLENVNNDLKELHNLTDSIRKRYKK